MASIIVSAMHDACMMHVYFIFCNYFYLSSVCIMSRSSGDWATRNGALLLFFSPVVGSWHYLFIVFLPNCKKNNNVKTTDKFLQHAKTLFIWH